MTPPAQEAGSAAASRLRRHSSTLIVVPTLNEAENIPELVQRIGAAAPDADLLIVDDQSTDGTAEAAVHAFRARPGYSVWVRSGPRGLGRSYADAFSRAVAAGYEAVVQMDADLSHDPASIPALLDALKEADLVIGSRYCPGGGVEGWAWHRLALSRFANWYVRIVTGLGVGDVTAGYRAWRVSALAMLDLNAIASAGYSFQVETTTRAYCAGLRIRETPIIFTDRRRGASKVTSGVLLESMVMPWRLRAYIRRMMGDARWRRSS